MAKISTLGKATLALLLAQTVILTALEGVLMYFHKSFVRNFTLNKTGRGISESDLIYHIIFMLTQAFQVIICVDTLFNRNTIQMVALAILNFITVAYAGIQTYQHMILEDVGTDGALWTPVDPNKFSGPEECKDYFQARMRPVEYTIIGIVGLCSLLLAVLSRYLIIEFGWENYRTYSADLKIRKAFVDITVLMTLIKMDIFFVGSYAIQLIPSEKLGYSKTLAETICVFVIATIAFIIAWYGTAKEQKYCIVLVIGILCFSEAYVIYRIVRVNQRYPEGSDPYLFTRRFLTLFLAIVFCLTLATLVYMGKCFRNMAEGIYVLTVYGSRGESEVDYDGLSIPKSNREKRRSQVAAARVNRRESFD